MTTLANLKSENSIGFIRLVAALAVVYGHSFSFGGFDLWWDSILLTNNQTSEARLAVDVFFILSGYLIAKSYCNCGNMVVFAWHRFLRIFPAFWVCVGVMALYAYAVHGVFEFSFLYHNLPLVIGVDTSIGGVFDENPFSSSINGALWTLPWELRAYCVVAALGFFGLVANRRIVLSIAVVLYVTFVAQILYYPGRETSPAITGGVRLFCFFFWGIVAHAYAAKIHLKSSFAIFSALVLLISTVAGVFVLNHSGGLFYIVAPIPLTYLVFYVGSLNYFSKINSRNDVSYGVYIYGTFVLSVLTDFGLNDVWLQYVLLAISITLVLAWLSWILVERRCLKMKSALDGVTISGLMRRG